MARHLFGATAADYASDPVGHIKRGAELTVWDRAVGGSLVTDLLADDQITPVETVASTGPGTRFYGPDGWTGPLWLDGGEGGRVAFRPLLPTSRQTVTVATEDTPPDESAYCQASLGIGFRLLGIETDHPARVRVYASEAGRGADLDRAEGEWPPQALVAEWVTTDEALTGWFSPVAHGYSAENPPSRITWITVTNLDDASAAVSVTLTYCTTEWELAPNDDVVTT